ncbi:hypothetical protein RND71_004133 [Anisodus tanguticus]|uniref:Uncharacterized protein n=1 Tax=Anisodus tanguticus TaxID=243964 RepID=A0AAE1SZ48_9SOLA|nr:hypothetical protein RND71_004133 [Anisodus tanguticus]
MADWEALTWYQWLFRNKQLDHWKHFTAKVMILFGKQHLESQISRLANLQQVTSWIEYQSCFEAISPGSMSQLYFHHALYMWINIGAIEPSHLSRNAMMSNMSAKATPMHAICGDIWFDTGQDFRADSNVLSLTGSEELKQHEGVTSLITHTMLAGEDAKTLECFPYLFKQPSLPLVFVDFKDITMYKKWKNGLHVCTWFDTGQYDSNEVVSVLLTAKGRKGCHLYSVHNKDEQVIADVSLNNFVDPVNTLMVVQEKEYDGGSRKTCRQGQA